MSTNRRPISRIITTIVSIVIWATYSIGAQASPAEDASGEANAEEYLNTKAGFLKQREDTLRKLMSQNPKDATGYAARASLNRQCGRYQQAIDDYTEVLKLKPEDSKAYCARAEAYLRLPNYHRAIDDYTKGLELDPKNARSYWDRGNAYKHLGNHKKAMGDFKKAIDEFTQAIAKSPSRVMYEDRAMLYEQIGEHKCAEADWTKARQLSENAQIDVYSQAIARNPKNAWALNQRGKQYFSMGQYAQAVNDITRAMSLNAQVVSSNWGLLYRGKAYAAVGNYDGAIQDYDQFIASALEDKQPRAVNADPFGSVPRDFLREGYLRRGEACLSLKRWQVALDDFTRVIGEFGHDSLGESVTNNPIQDNPLLAAAYQGRAQVYKAQGNDKMADEDFERAKQCGYCYLLDVRK